MGMHRRRPSSAARERGERGGERIARLDGLDDAGDDLVLEAGILPLGVLADDDDVDVLMAGLREWGRGGGKVRGWARSGRGGGSGTTGAAGACSAGARWARGGE